MVPTFGRKRVSRRTFFALCGRAARTQFWHADDSLMHSVFGTTIHQSAVHAARRKGCGIALQWSVEVGRAKALASRRFVIYLLILRHVQTPPDCCMVMWPEAMGMTYILKHLEADS